MILKHILKLSANSFLSFHIESGLGSVHSYYATCRGINKLFVPLKTTPVSF